MSDRRAFLEALARIPDQRDRVLVAMRSGRWWTKQALAEAVQGSPHAISARMSDLRRMGHRIEKQHVGKGLYLYRLVIAENGGGQDQGGRSMGAAH